MVGRAQASAGSAAPAASMDGLLVAGLSAAAMVLALVATWKGPGLTDDSVNYLSTGINVAGGRGWVMLGDQPLTIFPPGLAAIAAFGEVLGVGADTTLRLVSVVSFGAIVLLGHRLVGRVTDHRGVVLGSTVLLAVSPALLGLAKMAWSEPLFIVVTLLFLLALARVLERGVLRYADVAVLAALGSLAFLVRYIGLSVIALGGLALLASLRPLDRRTMARISLFGLACAAVVGACIVRNHAVDGSYLGKRIPSTDSLGDSTYRVGATLGGWVYPASETDSRTLVFVGATAVLPVALGLVAASRARREHCDENVARDDGGRIRLLCGGFVLVYVAYLVAASLGTAFEPINSRYLSPIYVPVVVLLAAGVGATLRTTSHRVWRSTVGLLAGLLIALHTAHSVDQARTGAADGIGYTVAGYQDSDLATAAIGLVEEQDDAVLLSNQPFGLWAATRLQPIRWAPLGSGFRGAPVVGELEALERLVACAPSSTYLVRYRYGSPRVLSQDEIRTVVDVKRVVVADDGAIFQLRTLGQVACPQTPPRPSRQR